jgi:hypothetical protein
LIPSNFETGSNQTDSSDLQNAKHNLQRISTDDGITIDFNPEWSNDDSSSRFNREHDSIKNDSIDMQYPKQERQITFTDDGIVILFNPE